MLTDAQLAMRVLVCWLLLLLAVSCLPVVRANSRSSPLQPTTSRCQPPTPRASVALRVLVVNEPALAEAINRLRGEWAERSGGEADGVGERRGRTWRRPRRSTPTWSSFPRATWANCAFAAGCGRCGRACWKATTFNAADIFPLVRSELMQWGGQVMALPLGIDCRIGISRTAGQPPAIALAGAGCAARRFQRARWACCSIRKR